MISKTIIGGVVLTAVLLSALACHPGTHVDETMWSHDATRAPPPPSSCDSTAVASEDLGSDVGVGGGGLCRCAWLLGGTYRFMTPYQCYVQCCTKWPRSFQFEWQGFMFPCVREGGHFEGLVYIPCPGSLKFKSPSSSSESTGYRGGRNNQHWTASQVLDDVAAVMADVEHTQRFHVRVRFLRENTAIATVSKCAMHESTLGAWMMSIPTAPTRRPRLPPATHVAWALDQLVALGVGSFVYRCGATSPSRLLPRDLLRHEIARPWVMSPRTRVAVKLVSGGEGGASSSSSPSSAGWSLTMAMHHYQMCVNVGVSHTGGVVDVWTACIPMHIRVRGWLGRGVAVLEDDGVGQWWATYFVDDDVLSWSLGPPARLWKFKRGARWAVMYGKWPIGSTRIVLWPASVSEEATATVPVPECKTLMWLDFVDDDEDEAVVVVQEPNKHEVWRVDLRASYNTSQFVVRHRYRGYFDHHNVRRMVLLSDGGKVLMVSSKSGGSYMLRTLEPREAVHECHDRTYKVDSRHFAEFDGSADEVRVFSTGGDLGTPCRVFPTNTGSSFKCGCGCVAFWEEEGHLDLCDGVTGCWLLRQPLLPNYPVSFDLRAFSLSSS
ncbi:hypothetical protein Pelo_16328 [Pelomyxa schiedti]|nr:hypothetical protein Pelo_16328 [Pelomyxa schiedti]